MDKIERFVTERNVSAFFSKVDAEPNLAKRIVLSRLLLEEANKFAHEAMWLDNIDTYIFKCDCQIKMHQALLKDRVRDGADASLIEHILENIQAIRKILTSTRRLLSERGNDLKET